MTMKYAHVGIFDRAKELANLPFQECNRSNPVTAEGRPETSAGTSKPQMALPKKQQTPAVIGVMSFSVFRRRRMASRNISGGGGN
jgi:hypothetical protein